MSTVLIKGGRWRIYVNCSDKGAQMKDISQLLL